MTMGELLDRLDSLQTQITTVAIVGILLAMAFAVVISTQDYRLERQGEELEEFRRWRAENFGGPEPLAISDAPTDEIPVVAPGTVEAPVIDVAAGLRMRVAEAREANRPRATPYPRNGRHRAS